jgi:thiamine kinase-like enzyme
VNITLDETDPLNATGHDNFANHFDEFGVLCGDYYISQYEEGNQILYSIVLEFETWYDRQFWEINKKDHKFGDIDAAFLAI